MSLDACGGENDGWLSMLRLSVLGGVMALMTIVIYIGGRWICCKYDGVTVFGAVGAGVDISGGGRRWTFRCWWSTCTLAVGGCVAT